MQLNLNFHSTIGKLIMHKHRLWKVGLLLLFLSALAVRIYNLNAPGILPEREFRSMFFARAHYYNRIDTIPGWQKEINQISLDKLGLLEPPILENFVGELYVFAGGEYIQIARILGSIFWLIGGFFLFMIARKLFSISAAFIATAYYLFVPLGILTSRSFQPDSLMIMLFLMSLFAIFWYNDKPTRFRVIAAASISALTLLVKPLPLFSIFAAFIAFSIYRKGWRRFIDFHFIIYSFITILPIALYYGYGLFGAGFLDTQADMSFRPNLLIHREFWENWLIVAVGSVGITALISGFLGWSLVRDKLQRLLLTALWISYVIFGLVFTHHIHTHSYYHLQLVVIIALSFGPLIGLLTEHFKVETANWFRPFIIVPILIVILFFNVRDVRAGLNAPSFESDQLAQEIGELVKHSSHLVLVSRHYGQSLEFYGRLSGAPWSKAIEYWLYRSPGERELSIQERLNNLGYAPDYFIITDFTGFNNRHPDLKEYLSANCTIFAESDQYVIYNGNCTQ
jgi:hypothetical protein